MCRAVYSMMSATIRIDGPGKSGVLSNGPRPDGVHRRPRRAQIGREARQPPAFDGGEIFGGVEGFDPDPFRRQPVEAVERLALELGARLAGPILEGCFCR